MGLWWCPRIKCVTSITIAIFPRSETTKLVTVNSITSLHNLLFTSVSPLFPRQSVFFFWLYATVVKFEFCELYWWRLSSNKPPPSALNVTLPAFAAERRRLHYCARSAPTAVDRYLLPAGRSAANPPAAVAAVDRWDRRTDGETDTRPLHRPCCACCAGSVKSYRKDKSKNCFNCFCAVLKLIL